MILLSALLASLTGLVAGERPAVRAQVELSAVAATVLPGKAVARAAIRPVNVLPASAVVAPAPHRASRAAPVRSVRDRLNLKQSWLN